MNCRSTIHAIKLLVAIALVFGVVTFSRAQKSSAAETFDVLIKNGKILDGTGNPWYLADVGIRADRIVAIGKLSDAHATMTINAGGRTVAPGFIDSLGQSENGPAHR